MILLIPFAAALTLEETVQRAALVNPDALISNLQQKRASLDTTEAWLQLGLTPSVSYGIRTQAGTSSGGIFWQVSLGALDPAAWMQVERRKSEGEGASWMATATTLDAQYAAAALYYDLVAAKAEVVATEQAVLAAQGTVDAASARVKAGLESELSGKSAQLELLSAQAVLQQAKAREAVAKARLERALEQPVDSVSVPEPLSMPETVDSPWLKAMSATVNAARWDHNRRIAGLFPAGYASIGQNYNDVAWHAELGLTWTLEGIAVPFVKERQAGLDYRIAQVQYEGLKRDLELGLTEARENARAAHATAEAARAREQLAVETLNVGQARLSAGLASILEVLRLQDEAVQARQDRVEAELTEALYVLVARKTAGTSW